MSSCRPRPATSFATESRRAALSSTARGATRSCATSGVATNATHAASCLITAAGSSSLLDRDAAASEGCRGRRAVGRAGLVVALRLGAIADAHQRQAPLEALGDAGDHVMDQRAHGAGHGVGVARVAQRLAQELLALPLHLDVRVGG